MCGGCGTIPGIAQEIALSAVLVLVLVAYVGAMLGLGFVARAQVRTVEDWVLAGRRLGLGLAIPTLLATWYGAGTLLVATDEVRSEGLRAAALDPIGAGLCLVLAGLFLAGPLWRMSLLTLPDFYGRVYGPRAEKAAAVLMVPGYFGWVAAQFVALAGVLELYAGVPVALGLPLVAAFGLLYTWLGGMWAVTLTDAVQLGVVTVGTLALLGAVALRLGDGALFAGLDALWRGLDPEKRRILPAQGEVWAWTGLLAAGALGNLPGQDLTQRIFAARSARVASAACVIAGVLYLALGAVPLLAGLGADLLFPDIADTALLPALATHLLSPGLATIWVLAVVSAVLSTIDSALLAPATVIAHNLLGREGEAVAGHRRAVAGVAVASLGVAYVGEDAWSLLEASYEVGMVSLLVPLALGVWGPVAGERTALASMGVGFVAWVAHKAVGADAFLGTPVPPGLGAAAVCLAVYLGGCALARVR